MQIVPLLICTPTAPHPDGPPGFLPFILLSVPGHVLYLKQCWSPSLPHSPSISTSFPLWFVYMLSLLICFLLPTRDLSPVHGTVLANLEIDLSLWDGSDIVCSWNKRKYHLGCSLFHTLSDSPVTGFLVASLLWNFPPQIEKQPVMLLLYIQRHFNTRRVFIEMAVREK